MKPCIYSLSCPISSEIRYVGRTRNPTERFKQHINLSKRGSKSNPKLYLWIKGLLDAGLEPIYKVIVECDTIRELSESENYYINLYSLSGLLLNIDQIRTQYSIISIEDAKSMMKKHKINQMDVGLAIGINRGLVCAFLNNRMPMMSTKKVKLMREYLLSF